MSLISVIKKNDQKLYIISQKVLCDLKEKIPLKEKIHSVLTTSIFVKVILGERKLANASNKTRTLA